MPHTLKLPIALALALAAAITAPAPRALAAAHDGLWSVLIITEKGDCDRGYRYSVSVKDGQVRYQGDASVDLSGTVAANGAVAVNIRFGGKGANGTGRLARSSGEGVWQGNGSGTTCSGRWEAERK